jgi:phytoene dehydrogenase-like protein
MSCFVQYAPYELRGSDWETERDAFGDRAQAVLEEHFPGFGGLVLHREVVTPVDIERHTASMMRSATKPGISRLSLSGRFPVTR